MAQRRPADRLAATAVDRVVAEQIAGRHTRWWQWRRRERLRVHVLDALVMARRAQAARGPGGARD